MPRFSFGQVEAVLAQLTGIAPDKRVAFSSRLKNLQKQGLRGEGSEPGRGRAAVMSFGELVQLATGVELLRLGLPPQRAASLVRHNWGQLRYSAYLGTFTDFEAAELAEQNDLDAPELTYAWLFRSDALAEMTVFGASEFDDYEAVEAIALSDLRTLFDIGASGGADDVDGVPRRYLAINGTALCRQLISIIAYDFKFALVEEMREDLLEEAQRLTDLINSNPFKDGLGLSPEQSERVKRKMRDLGETDFSVSPPIPAERVRAQAKELIKRISRSACDALIAISQDGEIVIDDTSRSALMELVQHGALEAGSGENSLAITLVGQVAHRLLTEAQTDGNS